MNGAGAVRWGILSTARINDKLLAGAREADGVEVVAVGSRDRARGQEFADRHGIGRVHGSYEDLLADHDVDAAAKQISRIRVTLMPARRAASALPPTA